MNKLLMVHNVDEPLEVRTQADRFVEKGKIYSMKDSGPGILGDMQMCARIIDIAGLLEIIKNLKEENEKLKESTLFVPQETAIDASGASLEHGLLE